MSVHQSSVSWQNKISTYSMPTDQHQHAFANNTGSYKPSEALLNANDENWKLAMTATSVVNKEAAKFSTPFMSREDLVQEGYIGLLKAAEKYNPDRGVLFQTYARWWVRAQMARSISNKGRTVRVPGGALEQMRTLRRIRNKMESQGQKTDVSTLSAQTGIEVSRIRFLLDRENGGFTCNELDESGTPVYEQQPCNKISPESSLIKEELIKVVLKSYHNILSEREKYVINGYFGLDGAQPKTLSQIGKELGLSRERVRQIRFNVYQKYRKYLQKSNAT